MLDNNVEIVTKDINTLIKDAKKLFDEAGAAADDKANELRERGMSMLDTALEKAQATQATAVQCGTDMAHTATDYVKANPWGAITMSAGVGLIMGILLTRN